MSQNWMRHFELLILAENGEGISLRDFKVTFKTEWADTKFPRVCTMKIYNLTKDTASRILGQEFAKIKLIAGYDGLASAVDASQVGVVKNISSSQVGQTDGQNFGEIFSGDIRFTITGRDNPTDTFVLIQAIDSLQAFLYSTVNTTLAAGYTVADMLAVTMRTFNPSGVTQGITGATPTTVFPRGRAIYQSSRKVMDNIAAQCNATWQLVDGQLQMVPEDKYIHEAIVLNSDTGMIGMPQQTMGAGVNVKCLINPNIRVKGLVEIDQASVYRAQLKNNDLVPKAKDSNGKQVVVKAGETLDATGNFVVGDVGQKPASIAADGVYVVKTINYTGDTRGQEWYMELMCFARGSRKLYNQSTLQKKQSQNSNKSKHRRL